MENIDKNIYPRTRNVGVPSGTETERDPSLMKLSVLKNFLSEKAQLGYNEFSSFGQRVILRVLKNSGFDSSSNFDCVDGIEIQIDDCRLIVKESTFKGITSTLFQYENGDRCILENFTLPDLVNGLERLVQEHANEQFSSVAPIKRLSYEQAKEAYSTIKQCMEGWDNVSEPETREEIEDSIDQQDWKSPKRTMQSRWNLRVLKTNEILRDSRALVGAEHAIYEVNGIPVGMLVMECYEGQNKINVLVTHPGFEGAGGSLIEYAVNRFNELGHGSSVYLVPFGDESKRAYEKMGFELILIQMKLEPNKRPDVWSKDSENRWRLKKHMEKQYLKQYS